MPGPSEGLLIIAAEFESTKGFLCSLLFNNVGVYKNRTNCNEQISALAMNQPQ